MTATGKRRRAHAMAGARAAVVAAALLLAAPRAGADTLAAGVALRIADRASPARRAVQLELRATAIAGGQDPSAAGATVQLVNPATGEASSVFAMPAAGWRCRGGRCAYRDRRLANGPVRSAALATNRLRLTAAGAALDYALRGAAPQGGVGVEVTIGTNRVCAVFGGAVRKDDPAHGRFVAVRAPAPPACPATSVRRAAVPTVALGGCAASGYVASVGVGAGGSFALIVDSGSTTLGVASTACAACAGVSPELDAATVTATGARATSQYADGSGWVGPVVDAPVALPGVPPVAMGVVAIDAQDGFFGPSDCSFAPVTDAYQGIIGLGGAALALRGTDAYVEELAAAGAVPDVFGFQLCDTGGRLWLGGWDAGATRAAPAWSPLAGGTPFYAVAVSDLAVGGQHVASAATLGPAIVDSGTTLLLVPPSVFAAIGAAVAAVNVFAQNFGSAAFFSGELCASPAASLSRADLDAMLPALTVRLPSVGGGTFALTLPATDSYLLHQTDTSGTDFYCPGIAASSVTILGANALHPFVTIVDRRGGRVGFAPEQGCDALAATSRTAVPLAVPGGSTRPAPPYRHPRTP